MDEDLKKEIRGFALQNSSAHGGSTDSKIIIGKILGTRPELRSMTGQIIPEIQSIVKEVNAMSAADQIAERAYLLAIFLDSFSAPDSCMAETAAFISDFVQRLLPKHFEIALRCMPLDLSSATSMGRDPL